MYASVHAKQLWFVRRTSINLNYSWNTIHHNLKTASVSLKLYKEESNERQLTGGKRKNNKAKRIIWGQNLKRKPELAVVGVNYFHLHLSVCCSHTHKKKMMRKISLLCKLSRFGSCCLPEDEWKSSIACVDWDDEHVEFSGFPFCPEIAGLHSCRWWQPWIETNEREILRDIERDRETGRQREIDR